MTGSVEGLRRALAARARGRGNRVALELKTRVRGYALFRREQGATYAQIGEELKLPMESVRRWTLGGESSSKLRAAVPVEVVAEETSSASIVSPSGFRLEGLALEQAIRVLRALR